MEKNRARVARMKNIKISVPSDLFLEPSRFIFSLSPDMCHRIPHRRESFTNYQFWQFVSYIAEMFGGRRKSVARMSCRAKKYFWANNRGKMLRRVELTPLIAARLYHHRTYCSINLLLLQQSQCERDEMTQKLCEVHRMQSPSMLRPLPISSPVSENVH